MTTLERVVLSDGLVHVCQDGEPQALCGYPRRAALDVAARDASVTCLLCRRKAESREVRR